jgi:hypothetical protein
MSTIAGLQNADIQKHAIIRLLDAFELDVDPNDGRIYFPDDPLIELKVNDKIICAGIGKTKRDEYTLFNPLIREDHAQYLMQLAVYTRIFAGELTDFDATEADYTLSTAKLYEDSSGVQYPCEMTEVEVIDKEYRVCGVGLHEEPALATTYAVLDYLKQTKFITETVLKELLVILDSAYAEYKSLQEMGAFTRKQKLWEKDQLFNGPVIEDDSEWNIDDIPDYDYLDEPEWSPDELAVEFEEDDFVKADNDEWVDSDFTDKELVGLEIHLVDVPNTSPNPDETPSVTHDPDDETASNDGFDSPTTGTIIEIIEIDDPCRNNRQKLLPVPEISYDEYQPVLEGYSTGYEPVEDSWIL